jgi:prevent-host-death family protein
MRTDTEDLISITDANTRGISNLVARAGEGRRLVVLRNNKPAAVIVDIETMERLQRVEELEDDLRLLSIAWVRTLTDGGTRHDLEDVAAEFGVDLDEDEER